MVMTFASLAGRDQGGGARPRRVLPRRELPRSGLPGAGAVRRLLRCRNGISSVEFAIILPLLMMFLFSIIAFASALYAHVNMENAAREAVRRMAVAEAGYGSTEIGCNDATPPAVGTAEWTACQYLADWANFQVTADTPGCPELRVRVRVDAEEVALGDVFGFFTGRTLTAEVIMRQEEACA